MPHSRQLKEVLGEPGGVLAGVSGTKAAVQVAYSGGDLSASTIINLKKGNYGRLDTVRTLARAYAREILERHREEIAQAFGRADEATAEDWLCFVATSGQIAAARPQPAGIPDGTEPGLTEERVAEISRQAAREVVEALAARERDSYRERLAVRFREMRERLREEGFPLPEGAYHQGGSDGLTAEDAEAEVRAIEEMIRRFYTPGSRPRGRGRAAAPGGEGAR